VIECGEILYTGIDADKIMYETHDVLKRDGNYAGAVRRRVGIYMRTQTPCVLGYYEYELLGMVT